MTGDADARQIAALLEEHRVGILSGWLELLPHIPDGRFIHRPENEVRAWASQALTAAIEATADRAPEALRARSHELTGGLRRQEIGLDEVIAALMLLRDAAFPFFELRFGSEAKPLREALVFLDAGMRRLLGAVATAYADQMLRSLETARARTSLMLDAAETAGSSLDPDDVFEKVADGIASALRVSYCRVYEWDAHDQAFMPRHAIGSLPGERLNQLLGRPLRPAIDPLVQAVVEQREPVPWICAGKELFLGQTTCRGVRIASAVAVPIAASGRVLALVLGICKDPRRVFSRRRIEIAWGIARTVAPAVSNAHLYAETRAQLETSLGLQRVTEALLDHRAGEQALRVICREARQLVGAEGCALLEQTTSGALMVAARDGAFPEEIISRIESAPVRGAEEGLTQRGAEESAEDAERHPAVYGAEHTSIPPKPLLLNITRSTRPFDAVQGRGSLLSLPLRVGGDVQGALVLVAPDPRFDVADLRRLQLFADQGAIALEHSRLNAQHERMAVLEERQKLARDLHDSVTQALYALTMYAEAATRLLSSGDHEKASTYVRQLGETSLAALREMRLLIFELRPPALEREGLVGALRARLAAVEGRAGIATEIDCEDPGPLPAHVEEHLHGIAREALNNALKHAEARRIALVLRRENGALVLEVRDDGCGFDRDGARQAGGMGLRTMAERAAELGAKLSVASAPGKGTRVRIALPAPGPAPRPESEAVEKE